MESSKSKRRIHRKKMVVVGGAALVLAVALVTIPGKGFSVIGEVRNRSITVEPLAIRAAEPIQEPSPLTGAPCRNGAETPHRPIALMLAGNEEVRPLSSIGSADLVVEMPVVTWGINRFMAVFTCGGEDEIGSVRSARDDFIPLAAAFDAVFGHWGGSYLALNELNSGVIENINALQNPFDAYYRKPGILAPDNGFTTLARQLGAAEQLGYRTVLKDGWSPFVYAREQKGEQDAARIDIGYFGPYAVRWEYDTESGRYRRSRGNRTEVDTLTGEGVEAATVVTMRTSVIQRYGEYNDVRVTGDGEAVVYTSGRATKGRWEKAEEPLNAPLRFLDEDDEPIPFARGPVWLEVIQTDTLVTATAATKETSNKIQDTEKKQ